MLSNLLNNAAQYTSEGGSITLRAERAGESVSLSVTDTGIGIAHDKLDDIFQPFSQIEHPQLQRYEGLGIGLSLVKALVTLHGGSVSVESEGENQGSTFTVTLPLSPEPRD